MKLETNGDNKMASGSNVKYRIICLIDVFLLHSDENHILSMAELCEKLKEYGIDANRRAVLSDIKTLADTYFNIVPVNKPKKGYYLVPHNDLDVVYLTLKAILSSPQISDEDCQRIIKQQRMHMCQETADAVFSAIYTADRRDSAFHIEREIMLELRRAIRNGTCVEITYRLFNEANDFCDSWIEKSLRINPLKLVVAKRNLMLGFTKLTKDSTLYCIPFERISHVRPMRKAVEIPDNQDFDTAINFFTGTGIMHTAPARWLFLKCKSDVLEQVYEFFPGNMQIKKANEEGFFFAKIYAHFGCELTGWLIYMKDSVEILEPSDLKQAVEEMCLK